MKYYIYMSKVISIEELRDLFTKPYGSIAPTKEKWKEFYDSNVTFIDPTQKKEGFKKHYKP